VAGSETTEIELANRQPATATGDGRRVSRQLGVGSESLRIWVKRAEIDAGTRGGLTSAHEAELKELRREVRELRRANAILQSASAFFGAELDRRSAK